MCLCQACVGVCVLCGGELDGTSRRSVGTCRSADAVKEVLHVNTCSKKTGFQVTLALSFLPSVKAS